MGREADLLQACKSGTVAVIRRLLDANQKGTLSGTSLRIRKAANINCQDDDGRTPLQHAALNGHEEAVLLLLQYHASCQIPDNQGNFPLHMASWAGHSEVARILLEEGPSKASVDDANNAGDTALMLASHYGHLQVVRVLLKANADCQIVNSKGEAALDLASQYGHLSVVEQLVNAAPLIVTSIGEKRSPLHLATRNGHAKVVQYLLASGAEVNHKTNEGTALHEATLFGRLEVVEILLKAGIDTSLVNSSNETATALLEKHQGSRVSKDILARLEEAKAQNVRYSQVLRRGKDNRPPHPACVEELEEAPPKPVRSYTYRAKLDVDAESLAAGTAQNGDEIYGYSELGSSKTTAEDRDPAGNDLHGYSTVTARNRSAKKEEEDLYGYSTLTSASTVKVEEESLYSNSQLVREKSAGPGMEDHAKRNKSEEVTEEEDDDEGDRVEDKTSELNGSMDDTGADKVQLHESSSSTHLQLPDESDPFAGLSCGVNVSAKATPTSPAPEDDDLEWAQIDNLLEGLEDEIPTSFAESKAPVTVQQWLEQHHLGEYTKRLMDNGFDNLRFLGEDIMSTKELLRTGIRSQNDCNTIVAIASMLPETEIEVVEPETVAQWLESLCLSEYLEKLTTHGVDTVKKACALWDTELWQLGVDKPGHRRRMMASIRQLHALNPMLVGDVVLPEMTDEEIRRNVRTVSFSRLLILSRGEPRPPQVDIRKDYRGLSSLHVPQASNTSTPPPNVSVDTHERLPGHPEEDPNFDPNRPDVDRNTDPVKLRTPQDAQEHNKKLLAKLGVQTSGLKQMAERWRHQVDTLTSGCVNYEARYLGSMLVKNFKGPVTTQEACEKMRTSTANMRKIPFITISINSQAVSFIDTASKNTIQEHQLSTVLYIAQDHQDHSVFGYITRDELAAKLCYCHVFRATTPKLADEIVMTLGQAFEVAYQIVKRRKALAVMAAFESEVEERKKVKSGNVPKGDQS